MKANFANLWMAICFSRENGFSKGKFQLIWLLRCKDEDRCICAKLCRPAFKIDFFFSLMKTKGFVIFKLVIVDYFYAKG